MIFSFLSIVLAAIAFGVHSRIPGILIVASSIAGAILGGTLVAIIKALSIIGEVFIIIGGGKKKVVIPPTTSQ